MLGSADAVQAQRKISLGEAECCPREIPRPADESAGLQNDAPIINQLKYYWLRFRRVACIDNAEIP